MSNKTPGFYKILGPAPSENTNILKVTADTGTCCNTSATLSTLANTATNLSTSGIVSVTIDGTEYVFDTVASTHALLESGIRAALKKAGYQEIYGRAYAQSGAVTAAVATIVTTANITVMTNEAAANIAFS